MGEFPTDPGGFVLMQAGGQAGHTQRVTIKLNVNPTAPDFMLVTIAYDGGANNDAPTCPSIDCPNGWSRVDVTDESTDVGLAIYYKFAAAGDSNTYTWFMPASIVESASIREISGVNLTTPFDKFQAAPLSANTVLSAPSLTPTQIGDFPISAYAINSGLTNISGTIPGGSWSEDYLASIVGASSEGQHYLTATTDTTTPITNTLTFASAYTGVSALMLLLPNAFQAVAPGVTAQLPPVVNHLLTAGYDGSYAGKTDGTDTAGTDCGGAPGTGINGTSRFHCTNTASKQHIQTWMSVIIGSPFGVGNNGSGTGTGATAQKDNFDAPPGNGIVLDAVNLPTGEDYIGPTCLPDYTWITTMPETAFAHTAVPISSGNRVTYNRATCGGTYATYFPNYFDITSDTFFRNVYRAYQTARGSDDFVIDESTKCADNIKEIDYPGDSTGSIEFNTNTLATQAKLFWFSQMTFADNSLIGFICNPGMPNTNAQDPLDNNLPGQQQATNLLINMFEGELRPAHSDGTDFYAVAVSQFMNATAWLNVHYPTKSNLLLNYGQGGTAPTASSPCLPDRLVCGMWTLHLLSTSVLWMSVNGTNDQNVIDMESTSDPVIAAFPDSNIVPRGPLKTMGDPTNTGSNGSGCKNTSTGGYDSTQVGGAVDLVVACGQTPYAATIGCPCGLGNAVKLTINSVAITYTEVLTDTTAALVATGLANAINANGSLSPIVTAATDGAVVEVSNDLLNTRYTETGATVTGTTITALANSNVAIGVYLREFTDCRNFNVSIGTGVCMAIINATGTPFTPSSLTKYLKTNATAITQTYNRYLAAGFGIYGDDMLGTSSYGDGVSDSCDNAQCPNTRLYPLNWYWSLSIAPPIPPMSAEWMFQAPAVAMLYGCKEFTTNDVYNTDYSGASVDTNSATILSNAFAAGTTGGVGTPRFMAVNPIAVPYPSPIPVATVSGGHNPPFNTGPAVTTIPWLPSFFIQSGTDHHAFVLNTNTCQSYEMWNVTYDNINNQLDVYVGYQWDMTSAYAPRTNGGGPDAAGTSMMAGAVAYQDILNGDIHHAVGLVLPQANALSQWGYVGPAAGGAIGDACVTSCGANQDIMSGDHFRLKSTVTCPSAGTNPQANVICNGLKKYGGFVEDAQNTNAVTIHALLLNPDGTDPGWNSTDLGWLATNVHITDFDILTRGTLKCQTGHAGCT